MTQGQDPNPYEPPSDGGGSSAGPTPPEHTPPEVARYPSDTPGRAWQVFRETLSNGGRISLVAAVIGAYLTSNLIQLLPQIVRGQLSTPIFDPEAIRQQQQMNSELAPLVLGTNCATIVLGIVIGVMVFSLARPLRQMHFEGPASVPSLGDALSSASSRALPVAGVGFLWGLLSAAGLCLILPGLALAATLWVPVYIAATTRCGVGDSFSNAFSLIQRQWQAIVLLVICSFLGTVGIFCPVGALNLVPGVGLLLANVAGAVIYGLFTPFWYTACMLTLEERDREVYDTRIWEDGRWETEGADEPTGEGEEHATEW